MSKYFLSKINIYPIKSLSGISLQSAGVEERGLKHDRRLMLVDESNRFITQRPYPQMALIKVERKDNLLTVLHKQNKLSPLTIQALPYDEKEVSVQIWKDNVPALKYNNDVNDWFTEAIGIKCSLVYMPNTTKRNTNPDYAKNKIVSFADGYPFLIIGQSSLDDLNLRMEVPLPMNRFRTNFVFTGGKPFEEDEWKKIKIGEIVFEVLKPCARCVITTTNQETAERLHEPLLTLSKYRKIDNKVMFGQNMVSDRNGKVAIESRIEVLERK
ncbi:MAG: MOSC domain-containing protein [Ignavibacteria bacterium]|nr:MOSC domain-containing protein [Ignavibacteria bacterium]